MSVSSLWLGDRFLERSAVPWWYWVVTPQQAPDTIKTIAACAAMAGSRALFPYKLCSQARQRFVVLSGGFGNHFVGHTWRRRGFVPGFAVHQGLLQPVAHKLLVLAGRVGAFGVALLRPETAGVGRQHLVHQRQRAVGVQTKLELGVGNDDALGQRDLGRSFVNLDADVAEDRKSTR